MRQRMDKPWGKLWKRLFRDTGGNMSILMAAGMPALIGGSGLAVDTAQWYLWQKELQYAADQAAIAGAWSKANGSTGTDYQVRALQELEANKQVVDFDAQGTVALADYAFGKNNSVKVTVSASKMLPFTGFVTGDAVNVAVESVATFVEGGSYTACLVALDEEADSAVTLGGNSIVTARCGIAALSKSDKSITVPGNPELDPGWVVSAGGIDDWFNENTDAEVREYVQGLVDPFKDLTPPDNPTPRTYECSTGKAVYTATTTTTVTTVYKTFSDTKKNPSTLIKESDPVVSVTSITSSVDKNAKSSSQPDVQIETGQVTSTTSGAGGNTKTVYTRTDKYTTTVTTIGAITETTTVSSAITLPGTYKDFNTACDTMMSPGIYVIDGGTFTINAQNRVIGNGIMIVLKNGADIRINGGAEVSLSPMSAQDLTLLGLPEKEALKLDGMLVFEDRNSPGSNQNLINGNASTTLNGKIYLPRSPLEFKGTAKVSTHCLMISANMITISGTANMETFCPPGMSNEDIVAVLSGTVRLVV